MDRWFSYLRYLKYSNVINRLTYLKWDKFIEHSQWWSKEKFDDYQWKKVKQLLEHAYSNVPYYTELFQKIGATPNDIKTWKDYSQIPFLTKDIVRERAADLIDKNFTGKNSLHYYTTGGSTGQPLGFYKSPEISIIELAFMNQQWKRVGYIPSSSRVILRGSPVENSQLFQRFRFTNDWLISSYHLSAANMPKYVDFLNRIKPEFFHVYPASLYIFTQLLLESKLTLSFSPKAILCGSEPVHDYQRTLFEKVYNTRVYSWLGLAEGTTLAGECEHSTKYHAWPQHSFVELLDTQGNSISKEGRTGEIIGTSINNFCFPFIRYQSSDMAEFGGYGCSLCSRNFLILNNIKGRKQDKILLLDGRQIPLTAITFGLHFDAYGKIQKMQILQNEIGKIVIYLSVNSFVAFTKADEDEIITKMKSSVNGKLDIEICFTNEFIKSTTGKHIYFIQNLKFEKSIEKSND